MDQFQADCQGTRYIFQGPHHCNPFGNVLGECERALDTFLTN
jgi:hypothetical protein